MKLTGNNHIRELTGNGYSMVPGILDRETVSALQTSIAHLASENDSAGVRDLAAKCPAIRELAESPLIRTLVEPILGKEACLVRSILFTKNMDTNWGVSWHQDLAIAVRERAEIDGYSGWSMKEGVTHVQPPVSVLEGVLAVRLHLDPADVSNGALMVTPGSHSLGRIPAGEAADVAKRLGSHTCTAQAGDALLLRPLILHASSKSMSKVPRRVIHLEFAAVDLPAPLGWYERE